VFGLYGTVPEFAERNSKRNKNINNIDHLVQFCTPDVPLGIKSDLSQCIS